MTNGQYFIQQILEKRKEIEELNDEIDEYESNLTGAEIEYKGYNYTVIDYIAEDTAFIFIENEDQQWHESIDLEDLAKII